MGAAGILEVGFGLGRQVEHLPGLRRRYQRIGFGGDKELRHARFAARAGSTLIVRARVTHRRTDDDKCGRHNRGGILNTGDAAQAGADQGDHCAPSTAHKIGRGQQVGIGLVELVQVELAGAAPGSIVKRQRQVAGLGRRVRPCSAQLCLAHVAAVGKDDGCGALAVEGAVGGSHRRWL